MQAGGHRFDPGWLHQVFGSREAYRQAIVDGFAVRFIRLLFKNSEEVKRTRFSQTGFVWVVIALTSVGALSASALTKRFLWPLNFMKGVFHEAAPSGVQGYRVK